MSKLRDDSKWNLLSPEQREKLEEWLFDENLGYAKTLKRVKEQFGLEATISSLGRYYRRRAQERQMEEFLDAQEIAYQAKDLPLNVPVMREGLVKLLYKAALKLAVEKPGAVAELAAVTKLLLASEDNEIRRARQKLAERYFDYDAVAECQKELPHILAYLNATGYDESQTHEEKMERVHKMLFGWTGSKLNLNCHDKPKNGN